jgi:hypothetical protein
MEEMLEDIVDVEEDEELEEEASAEVDKVLFELTDGKLGQAGLVGTELPVRMICRSTGGFGYLTYTFSRWTTRFKTRT